MCIIYIIVEWVPSVRAVLFILDYLITNTVFLFIKTIESTNISSSYSTITYNLQTYNHRVFNFGGTYHKSMCINQPAITTIPNLQVKKSER